MNNLEELANAASSASRRRRVPQPSSMLPQTIGAALLGLVVIWFAWSRFDRAASRNAAQPTTLSQPVEVVFATPAELIASYKSNEIAADEYFKNRLVVVSGRAKSISRGITGGAYVTFDGEGFRDVQCMFNKEAEWSLVSLRAGQSVSIRGRCSGLLVNVMVSECEVLSANH
jgi:hypothetical protein